MTTCCTPSSTVFGGYNMVRARNDGPNNAINENKLYNVWIWRTLIFSGDTLTMHTIALLNYFLFNIFKILIMILYEKRNCKNTDNCRKWAIHYLPK